MFSPKVSKLPSIKSQGKSWAVLKSLDGKILHEFLLNPSMVEQDVTAEMTELAIAGTPSPLQKYKNSTDVIRFPGLVLVSSDYKKDIAGAIQELKSLARPNDRGALTPVKFEWGVQTIRRCYLTSVSIKETQWRGGATVAAEVSLSFVDAPETPKIGTAPIDGELMTDREKAELAQKITEYYRKEKIKATADGIKQESKITVRDDGVYLENPKESPKRLGNTEEYQKLVSGQKPEVQSSLLNRGR